MIDEGQHHDQQIVTGLPTGTVLKPGDAHIGQKHLKPGDVRIGQKHLKPGDAHVARLYKKINS